jgi:hypothetical protein
MIATRDDMTAKDGIKLGRFDQSFVIRMIRDFLLALTIIVVFELGGRLLLAFNHFAREDREATDVAAEQLAQDVKDIMLNRGISTAWHPARLVRGPASRGDGAAGGGGVLHPVSRDGQCGRRPWSHHRAQLPVD